MGLDRDTFPLHTHTTQRSMTSMLLPNLAGYRRHTPRLRSLYVDPPRPSMLMGTAMEMEMGVGGIMQMDVEVWLEDREVGMGVCIPYRLFGRRG
jgi:hypothetical protein